MLSRSRRIRFLGITLLVVAVVPGLASVAFAGDPPVPADAATDDKPASEKATEADRVYVLNGATISWDLDRSQFRPPTAAQARVLAQRFREWTEARIDGGGGAPFTKEVVIEELGGGRRRARLPIHLMNATAVSVGPEGEFVGMCTEGPEGAAEALATPAVPAGEVWR